MKPIIEKYILYIFIIVLAVGAGFYYTIPKAQEAFSGKETLKNLTQTVSDLKKEVEITQQKKTQVKSEPQEKKIYEANDASQAGLSFDDMMLEMILGIAKDSSLKVKTINFDKALESDPIKNNHASTHDSKLLSAEVIGTYTQLQTFLREVFRHEYLIGVKKIEITPYEGDRKILLVNLELSLYAKK